MVNSAGNVALGTRTPQGALVVYKGNMGIGTWTAEMFLIFHLGRPDIFPVKDLGVLKAIDLHYYPQAKKRKKPAQYEKLAKKWAPYRTVATWYLWRALDPVAVEY